MIETLRGACQTGGEFGYSVIDVRIKIVELEIGESPDVSISLGAALSLALRQAETDRGETGNLRRRFPERQCTARYCHLASYTYHR